MTIRDLQNGACVGSAMGVSMMLFAAKEEFRAAGILVAAIVWFPFVFAWLFPDKPRP